MAITGNLRTMELVELLQWLSGASKTGTLEVQGRPYRKSIVFRDGKIIASQSTDPREQLGAMLVSHGFVTDQELAKAVEVQRERQMLLGEILVAAGALTHDDLQRILRLKAEEIVYDVFTWGEGEFRFRDDELPPAETLVPLRLEVPAVVLEGMQRIDEWQRIRERIPDLAGVPVAVAPFDESEMGEWDATVLSAIDDDRTIAEISRATRASDFYVCRVLLRQALAGTVKIVRPRSSGPGFGSGVAQTPLIDGATLLGEARQRLGKGELEQTLRFLRAARALDPDDRKVAAEAAEIEGEVRTRLDKTALRPTDVPVLARSLAELSKLHLSPQEGFLLSRIDGVQPIAQLLKLGPMSPTDTQLLLRKMVDAGHVRLTTKR